MIFRWRILDNIRSVQPQKKDWRFYFGWFNFVTSNIVFLIMIALPFSSLEGTHLVFWVTVCLVYTEVTFVIAHLLLGSFYWNPIKRRWTACYNWCKDKLSRTKAIRWCAPWSPERRMWAPTITACYFRMLIMCITTSAMPFTDSFTLIWILFHFFPIMHVVLCKCGCWNYKKDNDYEFLHFIFFTLPT